ncbi:hypothetical protein PR048_030002 [Dryococelus australis]|uniref:Uncharacterized protein n=1 Tax=Dryococelus australis TaxID=614101 RepID=A0ABQ9G7Q3_9NEOP|nr:hypothetical protein PR048_030002 [Dryococelus australis]
MLRNEKAFFNERLYRYFPGLHVRLTRHPSNMSGIWLVGDLHKYATPIFFNIWICDRRCSILTSIAFIGSQDLAVRPTQISLLHSLVSCFGGQELSCAEKGEEEEEYLLPSCHFNITYFFLLADDCAMASNRVGFHPKSIQISPLVSEIRNWRRILHRAYRGVFKAGQQDCMSSSEAVGNGDTAAEQLFSVVVLHDRRHEEKDNGRQPAKLDTAVTVVQSALAYNLAMHASLVAIAVLDNAECERACSGDDVNYRRLHAGVATCFKKTRTMIAVLRRPALSPHFVQDTPCAQTWARNSRARSASRPSVALILHRVKPVLPGRECPVVLTHANAAVCARAGDTRNAGLLADFTPPTILQITRKLPFFPNTLIHFPRGNVALEDANRLTAYLAEGTRSSVRHVVAGEFDSSLVAPGYRLGYPTYLYMPPLDARQCGTAGRLGDGVLPFHPLYDPSSAPGQRCLEMVRRCLLPISTLTSRRGEPGSIAGRVTGFSQVGIVPDDAVGWRVFSGTSRYPPSLHSGATPYSLQSPSSALKTSLLRAAQISSSSSVDIRGSKMIATEVPVVRSSDRLVKSGVWQTTVDETPHDSGARRRRRTEEDFLGCRRQTEEVLQVSSPGLDEELRKFSSGAEGKPKKALQASTNNNENFSGAEDELDELEGAPRVSTTI